MKKEDFKLRYWYSNIYKGASLLASLATIYQVIFGH